MSEQPPVDPGDQESAPASHTPSGWPEVMTSAEAAAYLRVSPNTLRLALLAGELPGIRVGSNWRLLRSHLDARMALSEPSATQPGRARQRKGVPLGPRKKKPPAASEAPQPQTPGAAAAQPEE